jgi:hypothetical protein
MAQHLALAFEGAAKVQNTQKSQKYGGEKIYRFARSLFVVDCDELVRSGLRNRKL